MISQGLRLLSSSLRVLLAVYNLSSRWGPYIIANATVERRQRECVVLCEEIPQIKIELHEFLSSLDDQVFLPELLKAISSEQSDIMAFEHAADFLQIFYGILILFITRASLKAISYSFGDDFNLLPRQAMQDPTFDRGWNCPLYQPMLYALGCSEVCFERILQGLNHETGVYEHCETAAHLFPVRPYAFMIEHISYFFEQHFPSSKDNIEMGDGAEGNLAQMAQLGVLSMG